MRRLALVPLLTLGFLLFPPAASALGLGEIEMQSALNERLDAEIPLRGVTEDDGEQIIVTLASEEAFRQVGLQRPFALTRLQFEVKQHADGQHYVHVTSREPIVEPFLSFLVEVDWPGGNLLREYTVLLDPPVFVSEAQKREPAAEAAPAAPAKADTEAVTAAGVATEIEREKEPGVEPEPAAEPEPEPEPAAAPEAEPEMVAQPAPPAGDFSDTPVFLQVEQEEERAEAEARRAAEATAATEPEIGAATTRGYEAGPDEYGPVRRGENLWNIATRLKRADMTVQQMMLALLRYNPEAFIDGNINRLKQGYVLRIPDAGEVLSLSAQQAVARVREQNALWQEFRRAARAGGAAPAVEAEAAATGTKVAGEDASLKIVGSEEGTGAGSEEPASATTSGSEQPGEQLKLVREQLESTEMEKNELQSRVDELEQTVDKMERLIEVREDQLARLQEQLRQVEQAGQTDDEAVAAADDATGTTDTAVDDQEPTAAADTDTAGDETTTGETAAGETADEDITVAEADTGAAAEADTGDAEATATSQATGAEATAGEADTGVVTARTRPAERGWMDKAADFWDSVQMTVTGMVAGVGLGSLLAHPFALPALGGAVVVLLLGFLLLARRRRAGGDEELEVGPGGEAVLAGGGADEEDDEFAALLQSDSGDDVALEEDEGGEWSGDDTATGEDAESALMTEEFNLDDLDKEEEDRTVTSGASEDDTIAEADVYLAYGLHQQAEDLLKLALQEHPDRLDYHAKMLETLYGAGKTEEFVERAEAFQAKVGDPDDGLWLRTVAMGKELAPDNPLFQQEVDENLKPAEPSAGQPPGADFEVGGEGEDSTDLDFSFGDEGEGVDEKDDEQFGRTVMLDSEEFGEGPAEKAEGDAGLAGPGGAGPEPGSTAGDEEMDFDLSDFSLDEPEQGGASEPEAESADESGSEFEFDLGDLDVDDEDVSELPTDSGDSEEETAAAGSEDEGFDIDLDDLDEGGTDEPERADSGEAESFDVGDLELESDEPGTPAAGDDAGAIESPDEETIALDTGDDSSLEELEGALAGGGTDSAGADTGGDEDEFDTMLDLARAYIDMGDAESARAALEEVAESGNEKQRSEAQSLLESV